MKKQIITIMALFCAFQLAMAQTEKGSQTLGLNLGFNYSKNSSNDVSNSSTGATTLTENKTTSYIIGLNYGYFIAHNIDIGVNLNYNNMHGDNTGNYNLVTQRENSYSANLYLRKYFLYANKLGFRTGGVIGYYHDDLKYNYVNSGYTNTSNKGNNYSAGAMLDFVYYPSSKFGLAASIATLSYNHLKKNYYDGSADKFDNVSFNFINNNLSFSAFYTFGGK